MGRDLFKREEEIPARLPRGCGCRIPHGRMWAGGLSSLLCVSPWTSLSIFTVWWLRLSSAVATVSQTPWGALGLQGQLRS